MTSKNAHIKAIGVCLKKETAARAAIFDATQHKHDETLGTIIHRAPTVIVDAYLDACTARVNSENAAIEDGCANRNSLGGICFR